MISTQVNLDRQFVDDINGQVMKIVSKCTRKRDERRDAKTRSTTDAGMYIYHIKYMIGQILGRITSHLDIPPSGGRWESFFLLASEDRPACNREWTFPLNRSDNISPSFTRELMPLNNSLLKGIKYFETLWRKENYTCNRIW